MSDYKVNLQSDWEEFSKEVRHLSRTRVPSPTVQELMDLTGGDYEDVLWALKGR